MSDIHEDPRRTLKEIKSQPERGKTVEDIEIVNVPNVIREQDRLDKAITFVHETILQLEERLTPLLPPGEKEISTNIDVAEKGLRENCVTAALLAEFTHRLGTTNLKVLTLLNDLQI